MAGSAEVERTPDGRYIVVRGRRWRAADPGIPAELAAELVAELMAARRAVRTDPASARPRVQDAKTALGERGEPWWEPASHDGARTRLAAAMRTLLRHRDPDATIELRDAALVVGGAGWAELMDAAAEVALALGDAGTVRSLDAGDNDAGDNDDGDGDDAGTVRLGRGPAFDA